MTFLLRVVGRSLDGSTPVLLIASWLSAVHHGLAVKSRRGHIAGLFYEFNMKNLCFNM